LALIANNKDQVQTYLRILQQWCDENFFLVNHDKTGILRVGQVDSTAKENFKIHGKS